MKQKGLAPILIILFIAVVVGGYLMYQKQTKPVSVPQQVPQSTPATTSNPGSTNPVDIANWKTYTNTYFGLTFRYPSDNIIQENSNKLSYRLEIRPSFYQGNILSSDQNLYRKVFQISINIETNTQALTAQQIVDKEIVKITQNNPKDLTLQGMEKIARKSLKPYKVGDTEGMYAVFGEAHSIPSVFITKGNKIYTIQFMGPQGDPAYPETQTTIDQILSTFKFTQ